MPETRCIYKNEVEGWTAQIVIEDGIVTDCQVTPHPLSDFEKRMNERARTPRRYKIPSKNFDENPFQE